MNRRRAFTLVELVVVILILGILASVAAPRFLDTSSMAVESSLHQTLGVVRDAIELYSAQHGGALPGANGTEAKLKSDLAPYLRGSFPENPASGSSQVGVQTSGAKLVYTGGSYGWLYDNKTGEFIANSNDISTDGTTIYAQF